MVDSVDVHVNEQIDLPKRNDDDNFPMYEDLIESDEKEKEKSKPQVQQQEIKKQEDSISQSDSYGH